MTYHKAFDDWNKAKVSLNDKEAAIFIRAGEIRWAAIGVNVDCEIKLTRQF